MKVIAPPSLIFTKLVVGCIAAMQLALPALAIESSQVDPAMIVAAHNKWRSLVGVPPVVYSESLAASAQKWADWLEVTESCGMRHSHGDKGENLFWASAETSGAAQAISSTEVVDAWAQERVSYNAETNSCATGMICGHYTQVVWKNTTHVGCGLNVCNDNNNQVWVCQYSPPGNYVGKKPY